MELVKKRIAKIYSNCGENFGNGRDVRNLFQTIVIKQARRLNNINHATLSNDELQKIVPEDIPLQ